MRHQNKIYDLDRFAIQNDIATLQSFFLDGKYHPQFIPTQNAGCHVNLTYELKPSTFARHCGCSALCIDQVH